MSQRHQSVFVILCQCIVALACVSLIDVWMPVTLYGQSTVTGNSKLKIIEKALASIDLKLKSKSLNPYQKFELQLRYAELEIEKSGIVRDQNETTFAKQHDRWVARKRAGPEPKIDTTKSNRVLIKVQKILSAMIVGYPTHRDLDSVRYLKAQCACRLDQQNCGILMEDVIRKHPESKHVAAASLEAGEFYFNAQLYDLARGHLHRAASIPDFPSRYFAMYKEAWSVFNSGIAHPDEEIQNISLAVKIMMAVVRAEFARKAENSNLYQEAIRDLVVFGASFTDPKAVMVFIKQNSDKPSALDHVAKLGELLLSKGRSAEAIDTLTNRIAMNRFSPENPSVHLMISEAIGLDQDWTKLAQTFAEINTTYSSESLWYKKSTLDKEIKDRSLSEVGQATFDAAAKLHRMSIESKGADRVVSVSSKQLYELYLQHFQSEKRAIEARYYLADLYYEDGELIKAISHLKVVANSKHKLSGPATTQLINGLFELVGTSKGNETGASGQLDSTQQEVMRSVNTIGSKSDRPELMAQWMLEIAKIYDGAKMFPQALKSYEDLIVSKPKEDQCLEALQAIYRIQMSAGSLESLEGVLRRLSTHSKKFSPNLETLRKTQLRDVIGKIAVEHETKSRFTAAAEKYLQYSAEFPKSNWNADKAIFNAAANFQNARDSIRAAQTYKKVHQSYPGSPHAADALIAAAEIEKVMMLLDNAAKTSLIFAKSFPHHPGAGRALLFAAVAFKNSGDYQLAKTALALGDTLKVAQFDVRSATALRAEIAASEGACDQTIALLRPMAKQPVELQDFSSVFALAKAELQCGSETDGWNHLVALSSLFSRMPKEFRSYVQKRTIAETMFRFAEKKFARFDVRSFEQRSSRYGIDFDRLQATLLGTATYYEAVIGSGDPEFHLASLVRIGNLHQQIVVFLDGQSRSIEESTSEENRLAKAELKLAADQLRSQAGEFFREAARLGRENAVISEWLIRADAAASDFQKPTIKGTVQDKQLTRTEVRRH